MLSSLLKNTGDEEFGMDRPEGNSYHSRGYSFQWWHVALGVAILFPYISIFVLFGLVGNIKTETTNNYTTEQISSVSNFGGQALPTTQAGVGLSFASDGSLQVGGGTTLYKNIVNIEAPCPYYLSMDNIGSQYYILSYANKNSMNSSMQLVQMSSTDVSEATVLQVLPVGYYIYEIVTLSESSGTFLAICQDMSSEKVQAYVIAGKVSNNKISLSTSTAALYTGGYSATPQIVALSDSSFSIAYYNTNPARAATRYGTVDAASLAITLSAPCFFANDSTNSTTFNMAPLTAQSYMLFYYDSVYANGKSNPGDLHALIATVNDPQSAATTSISLSNTSVLSLASLSYFFAAATLDNTTVVVVYIDASLNNAVMAQVVRAVTLGDSEIVFGASWLVNSGASYEQLQTGYMDIDVQTISSNREFAVLYTDISNNGAVMVTTGQLTESNELLRTSPDFILFASNSNIEKVTTFGALASGVTSPENSQTAILVMQTDNNCDKSASSSFALLHKKPLPVGVSGALQSGSSGLGVAISGSVSGVSSALTPGKIYYTNTKGELVAGGSYAGHTNAASLAGLNGQSNLYYVYDTANNAYVSLSSKVGIATSSNTLFVQTPIS